MGLILISFQDFFFSVFQLGPVCKDPSTRLKSVKLPSLKVICWKPARRKFVSVGQDLIPSDAIQTFFDFVLALNASTLNVVYLFKYALSGSVDRFSVTVLVFTNLEIHFSCSISRRVIDCLSPLTRQHQDSTGCPKSKNKRRHYCCCVTFGSK